MPNLALFIRETYAKISEEEEWTLITKKIMRIMSKQKGMLKSFVTDPNTFRR
jgi:hypothetical protein